MPRRWWFGPARHHSPGRRQSRAPTGWPSAPSRPGRSCISCGSRNPIAFDLYHDYTETREGVDKYLNVVRGGQQGFESVGLHPRYRPAARDPVPPRRRDQRRRDGYRRTGQARDRSRGDPLPAVKKGQSVRLRISETYTDSARYRVEGDELVWDRGFGRPANAVVLPAGWYLTHSAVPATVSLLPDGRVRLDFVNPRLDEIQVLIVARRRPVP